MTNTAKHKPIRKKPHILIHTTTTFLNLFFFFKALGFQFGHNCMHSSVHASPNFEQLKT